MHSQLHKVFEFTLLAMTSIFFLVDPFAVIPMFLSIAAGSSPPERRQMARRAAITCAIILVAFAVAGSLIFRLFGITLSAFKIAGGLILALIGLQMLQAQSSGTKATPEEQEEGEAKSDASIIPLGMPMLAGPGTISTVMVLIGEAHYLWQHIIVYGAILLSSYISYLVLAGAGSVQRYLGATGIRIMMRLMGLLITAIAVQFIANGLIDFGLLKLPETPY
jgi:MarC family membrane protein